MSKIDNFFNKSLTDYTPEKDNWNVPDERLWEQSKEYFPKKEKKRRRFPWLFLLLGLSTVLVAIGIAHQRLNNKRQVASEEVEQAPSFNSNSDSDNLFVAKTKEIDINSDPDNLLVAKTKEIDINSDLPRSKVISENENSSLEGDVAKLSEPKVLFTPGVSNFSESEEEQTKVYSGGSNAEHDNNVIESNETISETYGINKVSEQAFSTKSIANNALVISEDLTSKNSEISEKTPFLSFNDLQRKQKFPLLSKRISSPIAISDDHLILVNKLSFPKNEIGISHMLLPLTFLEGQDLGEDPGDQIIFQADYKNVNLNLRHWIKPNWSIQTGIFASQIDADIDICVSFIATQEELEAMTNIEFREIMKKSNGSGNAKVDIEFRENSTVQIGDEIGLKGDVGLRLKALQMPLFIHHHWYKKRIEYFTGGGLTLEYIWGNQLMADFDMEVNGVPLNGKVIQDEVEEAYFDSSIYLEGGMKYHLTQQVNIGLTLRVAAIQPVFSGIDLGVNYRWHK